MEDTITIPTTERSLTSLVKAMLMVPPILGTLVIAIIGCLAMPPSVAALFALVALLCVSIQASLLARAVFGTVRISIEKDESDDDSDDDDE